MISHLALHDSTRTQLERFIARPSHALLLAGPTGIGKTAIAEALTEAILRARLATHPYHLRIRPGGSSISIDSVRELQKFLQLKTIGTQPFRRSVVIEDAHALTIEAQNAFLKLLEEPPADTLLILTANSSRDLLPTILSRAQTIAVNIPEEQHLRVILEKRQCDEEALRQACLLSGGLPGLLCALLDDENHPLRTSIDLAKELLQAQPFERMTMVDGLSKNKEEALRVTSALERVARAGLEAAAARDDTPRLRRWHKMRKAAADARNALKSSANTKLTLCNLLISLN